MSLAPTIHATSIVLGTQGVLIRGRPGAGKTALALHLLGQAGAHVYAALVSDDRTAVSAENGKLIARGIDSIAGLAEIRNLGIAPVKRRTGSACVTLIVDLVDRTETVRLPEPEDRKARIGNIDIDVLRLPDAKNGSLEAKAEAVFAALGLSRTCNAPPVDG